MPLPEINFSYWILQSLAMLLTALLIPRLTITGPLGALGTVVTLAFVNATIWDAALFFKIPDNLSLQTALLCIANGLIFWVLVKIPPGIEVDGLWPALVAPLVFTLCSLLISRYASALDWWQLFKTALQLLGQIRDYFLSVGSSAAGPAS